MNKMTKNGLFDTPKIKLIARYTLVALSILVIILDPLLHRHGHFGDHSIDSWFGFYGVLGFLGVISCIYIAIIIGKLISVKEDYYD